MLNRYEAYKKGDYVTATNPIPAELAAPKNDLSLIDFDDSSQSSSSNAAASAPDDLSGLFSLNAPAPQPQPLFNSFTPMGSNVQGGGMIGPGLSMPVTHSPSPMPFNHNGNGWAPAAPSLSPPQSTATPPASIMLPSTPSIHPSPPNYFNNTSGAPRGPVANSGLGMGTGIGMGRGISAGVGGLQPLQSQSQQQQIPSAAAQAPGKDPFADLAGLF